MYDFLMSEEWWMDTIMGGVVAGLMALAAVILGELISNKRIGDKIAGINGELMQAITGGKELLSSRDDGLSKEHDGLSKEHDGLSKEHDGLSKEHDGLSREHGEIKEKVTFIERSIIAQNSQNDAKMASLNHGQRDMVAVVDSIRSMGEEIKRLSLEMADMDLKNGLLRDDVLQLKTENTRLKEENQRLNQELQMKEKPKERSFTR